MRLLALGVLALLARVVAAAPTVVFLSDFGTTDDSVAICKGVILSIAPEARVVDLTHQVPPFSIADGARFLAATAPYYPAGTIFLAVVDPGVGGARKPMIARTRRGQYFVLPDNGLVTLVADRDGLTGAREIARAGWMRGGARSSTFHGRDVFAPAAAHLARGEDWRAAGPPIERPVRLAAAAAAIEGDTLRGQVIATDGPYGNLVSDVDRALFERLGYALGDTVTIEVGGERLALPFVRTFGDVPEGAALLYVDSRDHLAVAVNKGSFAALHRVTPPVPLVVRRKGSTP
jgi:hypothetical protein